MALQVIEPVKIEDPDEPFLKQAEDIAFEFINLSTKPKEASALAALKAPVYPRKTAGAAEGQQQQQQQATTQAQATGGLQEVQQGRQQPPTRLIAERLRMIGDEIDKDILDSQTTMALMKLFGHTVTAFTMTREHFTSICGSILSNTPQSFLSGWHQISFVYHAMLHVIRCVREGAEIPTQTREQQVANFVGPTLAELGLARWMATHGGMDNFGSRVEGEGATAVIHDSSVDPEN